MLILLHKTSVKQTRQEEKINIKKRYDYYKNEQARISIMFRTSSQLTKTAIL